MTLHGPKAQNCTGFHPRLMNHSEIPPELAMLYGVGEEDSMAKNGSSLCGLDTSRWNPLTPIPSSEFMMGVLDALQLYFVPPVMAVGTLGNLVVVCFFLRAPRNKASSSYYLAAIALADMSFLACLFALWISILGIDLYNRRGWCQLMSFLTSLSTFLPLWYVVVFAVDRVVVHFSKSTEPRKCRGQPLRAKVAILGVLIVGVVVHINTSLTVGVVDFPGFEKCIVLPRFIPYLHWFSLVDAIVNIVVPYSIICCAIIVLSRVTCADQCRCKGIPLSRPELKSNQCPAVEVNLLTRVTLWVLSTFLLTRLPSEVFRLIHVGRNFSELLLNPDPHEYYCQQLAQKLLFLSYSVKPLIYLCQHPVMVAAWKQVFCQLCLRTCGPKTITTLVTSSSGHVTSIEEETPVKRFVEVTTV